MYFDTWGQVFAFWGLLLLSFGAGMGLAGWWFARLYKGLESCKERILGQLDQYRRERDEYEARCDELESDIMDLQASQQPKRDAKGRFI